MTAPTAPVGDYDRQHPALAVRDVAAAVDFYTKRMSLASCLEETLLHTLDGVGPHTSGDLRHVEVLKRKHGIDYDTHASYRFVEKQDDPARSE